MLWCMDDRVNPLMDRKVAAFVPGFPQTVKVEAVKTKLPCQTSLKKWKLKMWKRSFCARPSSKVKVEDVKTKLSWETSLKIWKLKMWKRSFCTRPPSKSESLRCENEAFVQDLPQKVKVEDVKTKLSCKTSFQNWKLKTLLWDFFAVRSLCWKTSLLWDLFAVRSLWCKIFLLSDLFAVSCQISLLWDLFSAELLCCQMSLM